VLFTSAAKLHLATVGKEAFEDRKLRIPLGSPELRADLHKLQKITGPTGVPRFVADSDSAGHADRTWAGFLAIDAASTPATDFAFTPAPAKSSRWGGDSDDDISRHAKAGW
jgi:phage FluMu gp28-like protein